MDFKKSGFPEQLTHCSAHQRRRVVSRSGVGLLASFIAFFVIFLNVSSKVPLLNPVLQGFNNLGSLNNTPNLFSWSFSFSSTSCFSSYCGGNIVGSVDNDSSEKVDHMVLREKGENNVSKNVADRNSMDYGRKGGGLTYAHERNFTEDKKDGNFTHQESRGSWESPALNESKAGENLVLSNIYAQEMGNFSQILENVNFTSQQTIIKDNSVMANCNGQNVASKDSNDGGDVCGIGNDGNRTDNVSHVDQTNKEWQHPNVNDGGNMSLTEFSPKDSHVGRSQNIFYGDCDIFNGRWLKDYTKPYYPPGSCPYIDKDFDCHRNKRPDDEYVRWKWQPYGCDVPSLNATDFLERLRGQKLVFVGDSLNRNMWESLVCILWQSVPDKKRVYEISGKREFKKRGCYAFKFEDYNCTVDFISSKFLVRESSFHGVNGSFDTLRLDLMDLSAALYQDADILIFNTGHWWTHEKTSRGEYYYQEGNHVHPKLRVLEAFKRALATWARWVDKTIDAKRTKVIFRGYSMTHFREGRWNSGGQCHTETEPVVNETHLAHYPPKMRALENVIQQMNTPVVYLNISRLTDFRKDGHPSIYRREYKSLEEQNAALSAQDCSHWCLPGVPDTWNELLNSALLRAVQGSSIP